MTGRQYNVNTIDNRVNMEQNVSDARCCILENRNLVKVSPII